MTKQKHKSTNNDRWTQQQFANLLGCDQTVVSRFISRKILTRSAPWQQWIKELYIYHAETSAGRSAEGLNLATERAKLARAQTARIGIELAQIRGELISREAIYHQIGAIISIIRTKILQIPSRAFSEHPQLPPAVFASFTKLVHEALAELATSRLPADIIKIIREIDEEAFEKASTNPEAVGGNGTQTPAPAKQKRSRGLKAVDRAMALGVQNASSAAENQSGAE